MQKIHSRLCKFSLALNVVLAIWVAGEKMENTFLRIIIGVYGQEVPQFVNSTTVINMAREKTDICTTEISLVNDYGKMSVNDVIKLANDIEKVRGGDLKIAKN